jgi:tetratricopeptide (TPR) repeat protein/predicted Ser/Thr protein kinase
VTRPALTPERWARAQQVFLDALEHEGAARERAVSQACAADDALAAEVRSLIAAHEAVGLLPDTVETPMPTETLTLQWVGPYHLLRELGRGGMGTVYLAERAGDGFTQRVALKLMRPDFADPRVIAALSAERRILARLEHPGIARFIDGGTTSSGQPFIAMEYVDGTPLPKHADAADLDVRERVALMMDVCAAVQYAHRQLVVHRDLKPGNIMVTADGTTKLLDFGIATVLDDSTGESTRETALWLTPAYASPEQVQGRPVSTLTDVYALGVVLYELLAGRSPYDFGDGSLGAITRAICEVAPEAPSAVAMRMGYPGRARLLAGDLDHVIRRALAKEPSERYGSVDQLCADLQNWLDHLPVRAGPDSVGRRLKRFTRRHRTLVAAGTVTLVALVAGLSTTLWQARRAGAERDRAQAALARSEEVTHFLIGLIESADPRRAPGDTTTGRAILQLGLQRVERLKDQPIVQADFLDALGHVLVSLGQYERSGELHERALALRRSVLGASHPDVAPSLTALAVSLRQRSQYTEAEGRLREALALQRAAFGGNDVRVAETLAELAYLMPYRGRHVEAESLYRASLEIFTAQLGPDHRRTLEIRQRWVARLRARDFALAESEARLLLADARRALGEDDPMPLNLMFHLGDYIATQRPDDPEAELLYRDGLAALERRVGSNHFDLVHGLNSLAARRAANRDFAEAEALLRRSWNIAQSLLGPDHASSMLGHAALAALYERAGRLDEAMAMRERVLADFERRLGPGHGAVAQMRAELASLAHRRGEFVRAEREWREAIAGMEHAFGPEHPAPIRARMQLAATLAAMGRREEAARLCAEGIAELERLHSNAPAILVESRAESPHCKWSGAAP